MPEENLPEIEARLHAVAGLLRESRRLDPDAQRILADLVDRLGQELRAGREPSESLVQLADRSTELLEVLQHHKERGVLTAARERVNAAILRAEEEAPFLTGIARRF